MYRRFIRKPFLYGTYVGAWIATFWGLFRIEEDPLQGAVVATIAIIYLTVFMSRNTHNHDLYLD